MSETAYDTTIDLKVHNAYKKSEELVQKQLTWQEEVDDMLDRMNELNGHLFELHKLLLKLTFEIERDFQNFKKSEYSEKFVRLMVKTLIKILNQVYRSDLYKGVKTNYHSLKQEISYLNELLNDKKISSELEVDKDISKIIKSTIKSAKRG